MFYSSLKSFATNLLARRSRPFLEPVPFSTEDFLSRQKYKPDYSIIAGSLVGHLDFETVMDVGCASGFLIEPLVQKGYAVRGIEVSPDVVNVLPDNFREIVEIGDFAETKGCYDLVCCVEVAEHIEPHRSVELVDVLCRVAGRHIYFTAAPPGQPGHGHINCRPHKQWIKWFHEHGWELDEETTERFRDDIASVSLTKWLIGNSFLFRPVD